MYNYDFRSSVTLVTTGSNYRSTSKTLNVFLIFNFTISVTYIIEVTYLGNIVQPKLSFRVHRLIASL